MTQSGDKAHRAMVEVRPLSVDGFQMPDGSYRMSQAQTAEYIGKTPQNTSNSLRSKALKALQEKEARIKVLRQSRSNLRSSSETWELKE
ncbi:hypothetical protein IQ273_20630 [Nodosilinea sp. LEGE 07298]|uniref:hypothetical protein n=1 Tax=Nodosilinea sp. LEGE 07298 TaxID=2777970 RepID=UPI00187EEED9|nr:hypothetical protein [Nodosilinea sp. LEGE 07298]MBE9111817.1 hypothetical protein [Nodosilinea sp. LEGE 07298]